jgi:hypothetical protein
VSSLSACNGKVEDLWNGKLSQSSAPLSWTAFPSPGRVFAEEPIVSSAFEASPANGVTKEELELAGKVFQRAGFEVQLKRATSTR